MKIAEIIKYLESVYPLDYQESYDNCGIQVGKANTEFSGALITLDVTEVHIDEAISKSCNLIISHHPLIFKGIKKITGNSALERIIEKSIKNDISIYSLHTNLDNHIQGLNGFVAEKLGLKNIRILQTKDNLLKKFVVYCPESHAELVRNALFEAGAGHIGHYDSCSFNTTGLGSFRGNSTTNPFVGVANELHFENEIRIEVVFPSVLQNELIAAMLQVHPYEEVAYDIFGIDNAYSKIGSGIVGELEDAVPINDFLKKIQQTFLIPSIKHNKPISKTIKRVAFCGGSGSFLIPHACKANADVYVTGDISYHDFFNDRLFIADIGHYESEADSTELIASQLTKKFNTFAFLISEIKSNPVNYFI
jgi:dinuclear metal center YbgI/SA1388 family protein